VVVESITAATAEEVMPTVVAVEHCKMDYGTTWVLD
jgi:hypothetical protein